MKIFLNYYLHILKLYFLFQFEHLYVKDEGSNTSCLFQGWNPKVRDCLLHLQISQNLNSWMITVFWFIITFRINQSTSVIKESSNGFVAVVQDRILPCCSKYLCQPNLAKLLPMAYHPKMKKKITMYVFLCYKIQNEKELLASFFIFCNCCKTGHTS